MEAIITAYIIVNFVSLIPISHAAEKRDVGFYKTMIISLVFSSIIGFLFILCHPSKAEVNYHDRMLEMMRKIADQTKIEEKN